MYHIFPPSFLRWKTKASWLSHWSFLTSWDWQMSHPAVWQCHRPAALTLQPASVWTHFTLHHPDPAQSSWFPAWLQTQPRCFYPFQSCLDRSCWSWLKSLHEVSFLAALGQAPLNPWSRSRHRPWQAVCPLVLTSVNTSLGTTCPRCSAKYMAFRLGLPQREAHWFLLVFLLWKS